MNRRGIILNVRGCNASGKTTSVREFIKSFPDAKIETIEGNVYTICSNDVVVLGRYDKKNGGCDGYSGKKQVMRAIHAIINDRAPKVIVYEGMLYSKTVKMACDVADIFRGMGYSYKGVYLFRSFASVISHLEARNGGADYDIMNISNTYRANETAFKTLREKGVDIKRICVEDIPIEKMGMILHGAIREAGIIRSSKTGSYFTSARGLKHEQTDHTQELRQSAMDE